MLIKSMTFILFYNHFVHLLKMPLGSLNHWNTLFIPLPHIIICAPIHKTMLYGNYFTKLGNTPIRYYTLFSPLHNTW